MDTECSYDILDVSCSSSFISQIVNKDKIRQTVRTTWGLQTPDTQGTQHRSDADPPSHAAPEQLGVITLSCLKSGGKWNVFQLKLSWQGSISPLSAWANLSRDVRSWSQIYVKFSLGRVRPSTLSLMMDSLMLLSFHAYFHPAGPINTWSGLYPTCLALSNGSDWLPLWSERAMKKMKYHMLLNWCCINHSTTTKLRQDELLIAIMFVITGMLRFLEIS